MEPNNRLENEFRKKLGQRTIQPSPMAWDRLDAMLSVTEEEKRKPKRTWMYVAASFLGFLLVGTLFLKQGSGDNSNNVVNDNNNAVVASPEPAAKQAVPQVNNIAGGEVTEQQEIVSVKATEIAVAETKAPAKKAVKHAGNTLNYNTTIAVPSPSNEAVAAVDKQEMQVGKSSDAENLLAQSLADNKTTAKKKPLKIDSNSLLSSVEGELNESFKEKALQGAVKNFNTIKTSVANRNHK